MAYQPCVSGSGPSVKMSPKPPPPATIAQTHASVSPKITANCRGARYLRHVGFDAPCSGKWLLLRPVLHQVGDDRRIGQRRRIAEVRCIALRNLAQNTPHDLAGARLGQSGRELDDVGPRDRPDLLADPLLEVVIERVNDAARVVIVQTN